MTHEEMIFKLLLFDKFLDEPAISLMKFCDAHPIFYNFFSKLVKLKHKIDWLTTAAALRSQGFLPVG